MQTVFVGLSGGVDSAVSAYLLKKKGYRVVGAFIKGWEPDFLPCTGVEDSLSAMQVAAHLQIPFVVYDLEEEYKRDVVDYFVGEYKKGRTPNPDVVCNSLIKFGSFWEQAKADGADHLATGHYAQVKKDNDEFTLQTSRDSEKDQTYFLWTLRQDDLAHSLFPVGGMEKAKVRSIAEDAGLPNAKRKDSQGLCFLGHVDMTEFLSRYIPKKEGKVLLESGKVIGKHEGAWFYTLGQRHGFFSSISERLYVVGKDLAKNEITVAFNPLGEDPAHEFALTNVNWISHKHDRRLLLARYRYRQELLPVTVRGDRVTFDTPQLIAPGQSLVFYKEGSCLGGAVVS